MMDTEAFVSSDRIDPATRQLRNQSPAAHAPRRGPGQEQTLITCRYLGVVLARSEGKWARRKDCATPPSG